MPANASNILFWKRFFRFSPAYATKIHFWRKFSCFFPAYATKILFWKIFCGIGWKKREKSFVREKFELFWYVLEARWRFNTTDTWWMRELMLCMQTLKRSFVNITKLKAGNFKHPEGSWVEALPSTQLNWMYVAAYVQFIWVEYTGNSTQLSVPWTECVLLLSGPKTAIEGVSKG